ncbi:olfactory receptor 52E4-like [Erpetoichthys calabaricus]|uniref:olfactory receptor 52E4-like n=1 Tax=Erpetoichthys calabaricus TaxID=27687 RepID=UPI0022345C4A|nr:olfactory receptor 52E4-like [Erpetoichthys calabaricus]
MSTVNISYVRPKEFILIGFPGMENYQIWISIPFCAMYVLALVANVLIIFLVKVNHNLHNPMYVLLAALSLVDLAMCSLALPKILQMFWFNDRTIAFEACFIQMFCVHFFSALESSILAIMAYDRYVALYNPLRYMSILSYRFLAQVFICLLLRDLILMGLVPVFASRLPFCSSNVIQHCYCDHMGVAKLACTDISMNSALGLFAISSIFGLDVIFIIFSYVLIMRTVVKIGSKDAFRKAVNTCSSHLFVILYFYTTLLFSLLVYRTGMKVQPQIHVMFAILYLLVPPVLNPLIYAIRTKEIRHALLKIILNKKIIPVNSQQRVKICI